MEGKRVRWKRIVGEDGKTIIVPMDHGVTSGPIDGIDSLGRTLGSIAQGVDAVVLHKGAFRRFWKKIPKTCGIIMHVSASVEFSPSPDSKVVVGDVEEALKLGADGISVHVNIGDDMDKNMLRDLGLVARDAESWGIPLLAMMYPRGRTVKDPFDAGLVAHVARVGAELGADIVKVPYTGSPESFARVVGGCFVPVVVAGGPKVSSDREFLSMVKGAMEAGAIGVSVGRNVFQRKDASSMLKALNLIVHGGASVDEALEALKSHR